MPKNGSISMFLLYFKAYNMLYLNRQREETEEFTHKIPEEAGRTGIMIGADCTVPTDIDDNRLEWVRQACIKYAEDKKR